MDLRPGTPEDVGMSSQRLRRLAELAESWVTEGLHSALTLVVARKGVIVLSWAYGRLRPGADSPPLALDSVFPIGSITKTITATAVLILVEDGIVGLNRPVQEYLPEFTGEGKDRVMVHHLLTHTSGLREMDVEAHAAHRRQTANLPSPPADLHPWLHERLLLGYDAPLGKEPGVEMSYCDFGFDLLGEIVRRWSGKHLAEFAAERIFAPLGMTDTSIGAPSSIVDRLVIRPDDAPFARDTRHPSGMYIIGLNTPLRREGRFANGGAFSTAADMAVFCQMFLNRGAYGGARILSAASVAEMTRNQIPGVGASFGTEHFPEVSWGLGWDVFGEKKTRSRSYGSLNSPRTFGHGGAGGTTVRVDPDREVVTVYFSSVLQLTPNGEYRWAADLFENAVIGAIEE